MSVPGKPRIRLRRPGEGETIVRLRSEERPLRPLWAKFDFADLEGRVIGSFGELVDHLREKEVDPVK